MALEFPRDLVAGIYLDGWYDFSSEVRQTDPITIGRGQPDELDLGTPSRLSAVLNNPNGDWVIGNPMSPHHGKLRQNVPVRLGFRIARDTFSRTVVNGMGDADTGETWTLDGAASAFAVNGSAATHSVAASGTFVACRAGVPVRNPYVKLDYTPAFTNVTGAALEPANIYFRWVDANNWYLIRVEATPIEEYQIYVIRKVAGVEEITGTPVTVIPGITHTVGQTVSIAAAMEGRTLLAKLWLTSGPEPADWDMIFTDTDEDALLGPGLWGIRSGVETGNTNAKPVVFTYDNVDVQTLRSSTELIKLTPGWDLSHSVKTASMQAKGILHRLSQGDTPAKSTLRRGMETAANVVGYWPCEEESQGATSIASGLDGGTTMVYNADGPTFASNTDFACSAALPVFRGNHWSFDIAPYAATGGMAFQFLISVPSVGSDNDRVLGAIYTTGTVLYYELRYFTGSGGTLALRGFTASGTMVVDSGAIGFAMDGNPSRCQVSFVQNGANVDIRIGVYRPVTDVVVFFDLTAATQTLGSATGGIMNPNSAHANVACGHVVVYKSSVDLTTLLDETKAYNGELAAARFERLCLENNILYMWDGEEASEPMGPQRPKKLMDLFMECVKAEQGWLFEPKSFVGLGFRARSRAYAQEPVLELDYAAKQVAADLVPAPDDQGLRNDILAKRSEGGEFRSTQTTGPKNINSPKDDPDGVNRYEGEVLVNTEHTSQLTDIADHALLLGTAPAARFPQITVDLAAASELTPELVMNAIDVEAGDRLLVTDLQAADIYSPVDQIVQGYEETMIDQYQHRIVFNASPYGPYNVLTLDTDDGRADGDVLLAEDLDTTETSIDVTTVGAELTTAVGDHPYRSTINGEEVIVEACSGSGTSFTLTVIRSANQVVRTHTAGDAVLLSPAVYLGRLGSL